MLFPFLFPFSKSRKAIFNIFFALREHFSAVFLCQFTKTSYFCPVLSSNRGRSTLLYLLNRDSNWTLDKA